MNKIDKIFENKLKHYSKNPSPKVWGQIQNKLIEKEGHKLKWLYYSAAAVLVLITGFLIFNSQQKDVPVLASKKNSVNMRISAPEIKELPKKVVAISSAKAFKHNSTVHVAHARDKSKGWNKKVNLKSTIVEHPQEEALPEKMVIKTDSVEDESFAFDNKETDFPDEEYHTSEEVVEPLTVVIKRSASSFAQRQNDTLPKNSFEKSPLGKVYRQMLNIKNGDRVDLKELGTNLLAFNKREKQTQNKRTN